MRARKENVPASILGKSLGSGVATHLASKESPGSLILDSAFTSMREVIAFHVQWLPKIFIPKMFESLGRVTKITCPTLVIHGDRDDLVPPVHASRLYQNLRAPKALRTIEGASHNDIDSFSQYYHWVLDFLNDPHSFIAEMQEESEI